MAQLIVRSTPTGTPEVIELRPGLNRIGRAPENDYFLDDPAISNKHCEIQVDNEFIMVRDLGSTNGTFIDRHRIQEAALYAGQTLQIGPLEMVLDARAVELSIPKLKTEANPYLANVEFLDDGHRACLGHSTRHAVWECTHCGRPYCDECVRKVRRVGGNALRLCPSCSNPCKLSEWSETIKNKKKNIFVAFAQKVGKSFKVTTQQLKHVLPRRKNPARKR